MKDVNKFINYNNSQVILLVDKENLKEENVLSDFFSQIIKKRKNVIFFSERKCSDNIAEKMLYVKDNGYLSRNSIEKISRYLRKIKLIDDIDVIYFDDILEIDTEKIYIMGVGDIISIIINKIKMISNYLRIPIILRLQSNINTEMYEKNPYDILGTFCKKEKIKSSIDKIIMIDSEESENVKVIYKKENVIQ